MALQNLSCPVTVLDVFEEPSETRRPEFLALNPSGRVPLMSLVDGTHLAESNAILFYLAAGTKYLPRHSLHAAQVMQWMFFEQHSHAPYIAEMRFLYLWGDLEGQPAGTEGRLRAGGAHALTVMEKHLSRQSYFAADVFTIADVALYAYTHIAPEAGFSLRRFPAIRGWMARVEEEQGFVEMRQ